MTQALTTISGAELKVRLGGLGLSPGWFAEHMNVSMRTVVRWFDGEDHVSEAVAAEVEKLSEQTLEEMLRMIGEVSEVGVVELKTYRTDKEFVLRTRHRWPASWHRMLTFRVMEHFRADERTVTIEYR